MGKHKKSSKKSKHHKKDKKRQRCKSSSSDSSSENEWVEKEPSRVEESLPTEQLETIPKAQREDWLDLNQILLTASTSDRRKLRELEKTKKRMEQQYDPSTCPRELNPYWKNGGTGLPEFKKPSEDLNIQNSNFKQHRKLNWKLPQKLESSMESPDILDSEEQTLVENKMDKELYSEHKNSSFIDPNIIAAKLVKAEIMGNTKLVAELKLKLEEAKQDKLKETECNSEIILTQTTSKGYSRPLSFNSNPYDSKKKKQKVETHSNKQRTHYYPDDNKYSLSQMFEAEKFSSASSLDEEFAKIAGDIKKNDNLADLFVDKIRHAGSTSKDIDKVISENKRTTETLDNCSKCLRSGLIQKHLLIDYNDDCYLSLPDFEPLIEGHCLISPVRHVSCSVQLDENEWNEINNLRLKLIKVFEEKGKSVIFFEIAKSFNRYPHMVLECIPISKKKYDMAPIYFKKAIDESEVEWSHNKKLVPLKDKGLRRAVPKGLSYFFVNFGMNEGFAHIIEDERIFPNNFAQEIIGGMLDIHHSKWRKPKRQNFEDQKSRVLQFNQWWKKLDK